MASIAAIHPLRFKPLLTAVMLSLSLALSLALLISLALALSHLLPLSQSLALSLALSLSLSSFSPNGVGIVALACSSASSALPRSPSSMPWPGSFRFCPDGPCTAFNC